jgi:hypothetical protein
MVQAFLKQWWVESDFKAPNLPLSLRLIRDMVMHNFLKMGRSDKVYHNDYMVEVA